eukprot:827394-Lingulodinium_polyedra.AAC.1
MVERPSALWGAIPTMCNEVQTCFTPRWARPKPGRNCALWGTRVVNTGFQKRKHILTFGTGVKTHVGC